MIRPIWSGSLQTVSAGAERRLDSETVRQFQHGSDSVQPRFVPIVWEQMFLSCNNCLTSNSSGLWQLNVTQSPLVRRVHVRVVQYTSNSYWAMGKNEGLLHVICTVLYPTCIDQKDNRYSSLPLCHKHCIPDDSLSTYHGKREFQLKLPSNHKPMWMGPLVVESNL